MSTSERSRRSTTDLRHSIAVIAGAAVPALLYLLYVIHYSVNVLNLDDWFVVPIADAALHGHLTFSALWNQYGDTRLFVSYLIFIAFAFIDHLNEKSIILFNVALFIASYILLLFLFRSSFGKKTQPRLFHSRSGVVQLGRYTERTLELSTLLVPDRLFLYCYGVSPSCSGAPSESMFRSRNHGGSCGVTIRCTRIYPLDSRFNLYPVDPSLGPQDVLRVGDLAHVCNGNAGNVSSRF